MAPKPLRGLSFPDIKNLPGSIGRGEPCTQDEIDCAVVPSDDHAVVVTEILDGLDVAILRKGGLVYPLTKAGYEAHTSKDTSHHSFFDWVMMNESRFDFLANGERLLGVWLQVAKGVHYDVLAEPFVCFDIMRGNDRTTFDRFKATISGRFIVPAVIHHGPAIAVDEVLQELGCSYFSTHDRAKGALWRVEKLTPYRHFGFLAKYVAPGYDRNLRAGLHNIGI